MSKGIHILGACYWRYEGKRRWEEGNAVQFMRDEEGTVKVKTSDNETVFVPNDPTRIRERTK